jgi:DNA-binding transcriptional LysR family regulator
LDIHHLRYFLAVCETLNFTRAAELCEVTQPALSRAIQQLEDEVGGQLLRRERNLTHLTDLGLLMKPRFQQIVDNLGTLKREAERFLTLDKASLSLGVMCTIGPMRFTGVLAHFRQAHPEVSVQVVEGTPPKLAKQLEEGEIDVAIMSRPEGFDASFDLSHLYEERFVVAFPAGHRFGTAADVSLRQLDGEDYLERLNCEYSNHIEGEMRERNCLVKTVYESEREDWIQNMVAGGFGIAIMPEFSAVIPGLQTRPIVSPKFSRDVCTVSIAGRQASQAAKRFTQSLQNYPWPESRLPSSKAA